MASGFDLSLVELDLVGEALGLDVRPFPFRIPWHGDLLEDRARLAVLVHERLTGRGLIDGPVFAEPVSRLLGLFARGNRSIAMLGTADRREYLARAATDGRSGVLATQHGETLHFEPADPESLPRRVLSLLPPMRPGPGSSITVSAQSTQSARPGRRPAEEDFSNLSVMRNGPAATAAGSQWAVAEEILRRPRLGSGYFVVTARDERGREGEPRTMNWLDTDAGRYAVIPSHGPDGRTHVVYAPADLPRLDHNLTRLFTTP